MTDEPKRTTQDLPRRVPPAFLSAARCEWIIRMEGSRVASSECAWCGAVVNGAPVECAVVALRRGGDV